MHRKSESTATLQNGNAFQALGKFPLATVLTKEGLERHLWWSRTLPPMSRWISSFDDKSMFASATIHIPDTDTHQVNAKSALNFYTG
jgi:hypothetical protein